MATDTETLRITEIVGELLRQAYAATVRPHRRSRYSADDTGVGVNATLTLQPARTAPASATEAEDTARRQRPRPASPPHPSRPPSAAARPSTRTPHASTEHLRPAMLLGTTNPLGRRP